MSEENWSYSNNCEVPEGLSLPEGTQRYALGIEYDGSKYCGWQYQDHSPSVQEAVEKAISKVADAAIRVSCAGRTDSGVHATAQVVHFDSTAPRTARQWRLGVNANLPRDIAVQWLKPVAAQFHARFSALSRRYLYLIANTPERPALLAGKASWYRQNLDYAAMRSCLELFLGEQDFSSFRATSCQAHSPIRRVIKADLLKRGEWMALDIEANGFLHHMVRNIVGALLAVGEGELSKQELAKILAGRNRKLAPATASPDGLYLIDISYAPEFELPKLGPWPLQFITAN